MSRAEKIHEEAIIIDATCPLAVLDQYHDNYRAGGVTVVAATVGYGVGDIGNINFTVRNLGNWYKRFRENPDKLHFVKSVNDIFQAKKEGKLGVIFHFQGSAPFEDDINMVEVYHRLGVRMCQLCYNAKDLVGCGCAVEEDTGLTEYGAKIIGEMNRLGIVVDCAHTGYKTTMDAIEASTSPVIISHGNAKAICNNRRNLEDELIQAIARKGGVVGFNGFPGFVADKPRPTLDDMLDHVDYMAKLVGPENISVGIDYYEYQAGVVDDDTANLIYNYLLESGSWNTTDYPAPPWYYPEGLEMPEKLVNLTIGLYKRGYSEDEIKGILGLNIIRVFRKIWK
ncbi:dipeptidase [bacterium]|nr:dipeptidase [bacterium]